MVMAWLSERGIRHSEWLKWSAEDRSKQMAFLLESAERCDMCGTAEWEWDENPYAYDAVDHFCKGCYMKAVFSDQESGGLPGTNVKLVPLTPMRKAQRMVNDKKRAQRAKRDREAEMNA